MEKKELGNIQRLGERFTKELSEIIKEVGKGRKVVSVEKLTDLIPRHRNWKKIREELIKHDFKK